MYTTAQCPGRDDSQLNCVTLGCPLCILKLESKQTNDRDEIDGKTNIYLLHYSAAAFPFSLSFMCNGISLWNDYNL